MGAAEPPAAIVDLAQQRQQARADKDFARSDSLRNAIAAAGWNVIDEAGGFRLEPRPLFEAYRTLPQALQASERLAPATCCIDLIVDGWPEDVRTCIEALLAHAPADARVLALDLGNVDGAGAVVHELVEQHSGRYPGQHPGRIVDIHVDQRLSEVGWSAACTALLELDPSPIHIVMDISSVLEGDAVTPLLAALDDPSVGASGWRGANFDADWRNVHDAGPGEVDVLLGYLMAVRREAALAAPPDPKARFYRNADLEWSVVLREQGFRLVVPDRDLPVRQDRHRGYHDSDPAVRDRESRKTYDRILKRIRSNPAHAPRAGES